VSVTFKTPSKDAKVNVRVDLSKGLVDSSEEQAECVDKNMAKVASSIDGDEVWLSRRPTHNESSEGKWWGYRRRGQKTLNQAQVPRVQLGVCVRVIE
jgi:hypothetical protein